jgi:toxin secretion/phage lysis holin
MDIRTIVCSIIGALGGWISYAFGGWNTSMVTLIIFMMIDYVTGLIVAGVFHASKKTNSGALESRAGFKGLCRKGVELFVVLIASQLDLLAGNSNIIRDAVVIAFICNETISIIENAGLIGVPIPSVIVQSIEMLNQQSSSEAKQTQSEADEATEKEESEEDK